MRPSHSLAHRTIVILETPIFTAISLEQLLLLLSPFAPHIVEEIWERLGFAAKYGKMCCQCDWPVYDEAKTCLLYTSRCV